MKGSHRLSFSGHLLGLRQQHATASRDFKHGVESNLIQKQRAKAHTTYEFRKS
jgi:hypothetical protein